MQGKEMHDIKIKDKILWSNLIDLKINLDLPSMEEVIKNLFELSKNDKEFSIEKDGVEEDE
jgi:hypothetical protein